VPPVDHVNQPRTQQNILFPRARAALHGRDQNCRVLNEITQNPAGRGKARHGVSKQNQCYGRGAVRTKPTSWVGCRENHAPPVSHATDRELT
jgi:hypothetical protein